MKTSTLITAAVVITTAGLGAFVAHRGSLPTHSHTLEPRTTAVGEVYYTCPMHPEVRQDGPGNCPICGMALVSRQTQAAPPDDTAVVVEIDPRMAQNLGMRTAPVRRGSASHTLDVVGSVHVDERRRLRVESRTTGWIESLAVRAEGDPVRKGQPLATLYSPELLAAERERALAQQRGDAGLIAASEERLRRLAGGRDSTLRAPSDGVVTALMAREGAQLAPGMPLMEIADLSTVWVLIDIPEALAGGVSVGQAAELRLSALPGERFPGTVDYLYPELVTETRSLRARLIVDNAAGRLRPGMYAQVALTAATPTHGLLIPTEALIRTGQRTGVMVAEAAGRYRPVAVVPGAELGAETVILEGLSEGERVVVSGQFLLDSEASLLGAYRRLSPLEGPGAAPRPEVHAPTPSHAHHAGMEHGGSPAQHRHHEGMEHGGSPAEHRPGMGGHHAGMEHGGAPAEHRLHGGGGGGGDGHHDGMEHGGSPAEHRPGPGGHHAGMAHGGTEPEHCPHGGHHDGMAHGGSPAEHHPGMGGNHAGIAHGGTEPTCCPHGGGHHDGMEHGGAPAASAPSAPPKAPAAGEGGQP